MFRIAVTDDWQNVAQQCADWAALKGQAEVQFFTQPFANEDAAAEALQAFDAILPMRERLRFPQSLLQRLPRLRLLALTGMGTRHVDIDWCNAHGIVCCGSGSSKSAGPAEFTLALILAAARHIAQADAEMHAGRFQERIGLGMTLEGKTLGLIGVGRIGARVAAYGRALDMRVLGWSQNLTREQARLAGVEAVSKDELLRQADVISLHLIYSERSRHILAANDLALIRQGAILVNTSRGPLIEEAALLAALHARRFTAALDVYDEEPLSANHPLRAAPNTLLTPHLGFVTTETFGNFYQQSVENILAFMQGRPLRVLNPDAFKSTARS